jgi:hypothetical protein
MLFGGREKRHEVMRRRAKVANAAVGGQRSYMKQDS